jgi:chemotaxis protein MotB
MKVNRLAWLLVVVSGAAAVGCGYSEEEWQAKLREISDLQAQVADRDGRIRQDEERLAELGTERDRLESLMRELTAQAGQLEGNLAEVQRLYDEARRREEQQAARLDRYRQAFASFREMIASGRLRVVFRNGQMVVQMASAILFSSGSADLGDQGRTTLGELAAVLIGIPDRNFQVAGHTDNVPTSSGSRYRDNWDLANARGVAVVRYLQEMGVDPRRLSAAGYGEYQAVSSNDTDVGREQNRRIEIVLMPSLDELPDLSSLEGETGGR